MRRVHCCPGAHLQRVPATLKRGSPLCYDNLATHWGAGAATRSSAPVRECWPGHTRRRSLVLSHAVAMSRHHHALFLARRRTAPVCSRRQRFVPCLHLQSCRARPSAGVGQRVTNAITYARFAASVHTSQNSTNRTLLLHERRQTARRERRLTDFVRFSCPTLRSRYGDPPTMFLRSAKRPAGVPSRMLQSAAL